MRGTAADQQSDAPVLSKALAAGAPVDADASVASPRLRALQQLGAQALSIADGDGRPTLELFGRRGGTEGALVPPIEAPMIHRAGQERGAMEADGFRDRNQRYGFLVARENARRIRADPAALEAGRRHLERFSAGDPHRRHGYALWSALLGEGADAVAARLTERSAQGDYTRETAPSFGGLPGPVRARLLREARSPLDDAMPSGAVE